MPDSERDLLLRATADASQAKAELGSLGETVAGIGPAAEAALNAASAAMDRLAQTSVKGGAEFKTALEAARDAVARLEIALNGVASPEAQAQLAEYDAKIRILTGSTNELTNASNRLHTEAQFGSARIRAFATALANMGGVVAEVVLPIFILHAALRILPQLFKGIEDAGTALGNMWAKMTGGIVENTKAQDAQEAALRKTDEAHKRAADSADLLTRESQLLGAGLIKETDNSKLLNLEYDARMARFRGLITTSEAYRKELAAFGIKVNESFQDATGSVNAFADKFEQTLSTQGPAAAKVFAELNKGYLEKVVEAYQSAGIKVPEELEKIIGTLDNFKTKLTAQRDEEQKLNDSMLRISDAIAATVGKYGSWKLAVEAQLPAIDSLMKQVEAQILQHGDHDGKLTKLLATMGNWRVEMGLTAIAQDNLKKKGDELALAWAAEGDKLDKLGKAYSDHRLKIEETRQAEIAAADASLLKVQQSTTEKTKALTEQWRAGELGNSDYFTKVANLQADEVAVRRKAQSDEQQINDEAAKSQANLRKDYDEQAGAIITKQKEMGVTLGDLKDAQIAVAATTHDQTEAMRTHIEVLVPLNGHVATAATNHRDLARDAKTVTDHIKNDHLPTLSALATIHEDRLNKALPATSTALASVATNVGAVTVVLPPAISQLNDLTTAGNAAAAAMNNAADAAARLAGIPSAQAAAASSDGASASAGDQ